MHERFSRPTRAGSALRETGLSGGRPGRWTAAWIVSPRQDLVWLIGGAAAGWGLFALHAVLRLDMLLVWFLWFVLLDSPHFFGTWARTYLDAEEWRQRRRLLLGSLAVFLIPPLVLATAFGLHGLGVPGATRLVPTLAAGVNLWAYWHVVRQHYGILSLYRRKNADLDPADRRVDDALLYVGLLAPFAAFVARHPETRLALGLPTAVAPSWDRLLVVGTAAAVALVAAAFAWRQASRWRAGRPLDLPKILFLAALVPLHVGVCLSEAVLTAPVLGFAAFVTVFHNVQYHALVRFYQHNRYGGAARGFGPAAWVGRSFARYATCALAWGAAAGLLACGLDLTPGCVPLLATSRTPLFADLTLRDLLLGVFLGFLMHHYLVDQLVWRPSRDPRLAVDLKLATA